MVHQRNHKEALLNLYLLVIEQVRPLTDPYDIILTLRQNGLSSGMCSAIIFLNNREDVNIHSKWIDKYIAKDAPFWGRTPYQAMLFRRTDRNDIIKGRIIEALELRVKNLKKELGYI